jgi:hypothetical protein
MNCKLPVLMHCKNQFSAVLLNDAVAKETGLLICCHCVKVANYGAVLI